MKMNEGLYGFIVSWWGIAFIYGVGPIALILLWVEYRDRKGVVDFKTKATALSVWLLLLSLALWVVFLILPIVGTPMALRPGAYSSWAHWMLRVNLAICFVGIVAGLGTTSRSAIFSAISGIAISLHWMRTTLP
jgi:hypothetical protein